MTNQDNRTHCSTCGHVIARSRRGLSSVEYRRILRDINEKEDLLTQKNKVIQIIRYASSNVDFTNEFAKTLDRKINSEENVKDVKNWLLEQLLITGKDGGEKHLYDHLHNTYLEGIDEPFAIFYENYSHWTDSPMTKNFVSRALRAIGLNPKMTRINFEGRQKSTMILKATADELREILERSTPV